jgi:hypothetical protein
LFQKKRDFLGLRSTCKGTLVFEHDLPGAAVAVTLCVTVITWVLVGV